MYRGAIMKILLTTACIAVLGYVSLKPDYTQEQIGLIQENAFIQGWEQGQRDLITETTESLCGGYEMNCGYAPSLAAPIRKPERDA